MYYVRSGTDNLLEDGCQHRSDSFSHLERRKVKKFGKKSAVLTKLLPPQTTLPAMPPQPERPLEKFPGY